MLIDKSIAVGREKLTRIQSFEQRIKDFYVNQALASEGYEAAVASVDEKEAAAIAALDVIDDRDFNCELVDGDKPSDSIRSAHEAKRMALNEYRAGIKQLMAVVRQAFVDKQQVQDGETN